MLDCVLLNLDKLLDVGLCWLLLLRPISEFRLFLLSFVLLPSSDMGFCSRFGLNEPGPEVWFRFVLASFILAYLNSSALRVLI